MLSLVHVHTMSARKGGRERGEEGGILGNKIISHSAKFKKSHHARLEQTNKLSELLLLVQPVNYLNKD